MTAWIENEEQLRSIYKPPMDLALKKELGKLDAHCQRFIALSPFICLGTSRSDGFGDVSPRGGEPGFIHILDESHIAIPDRPGNNRLDTLANIVNEPAVGILFFVPGFNEMLRVNGTAKVVVDPDLMARFVVQGKPPKSVIVVEVREAFLHCTKALKRADLWNPQKHVPRSALPSFGEMLRDQLEVATPAPEIDSLIIEDERKNLY